MSEIIKGLLNHFAERKSSTNKSSCLVHLHEVKKLDELFALQTAEIKDLKKSNEFLKDELTQLANFNPDWDMLETTRESLINSWDVNKDLQEENDNHLAETLRQSSEIEGLQLELTAALNFEEMYDALKAELNKPPWISVDSDAEIPDVILAKYSHRPDDCCVIKRTVAFENYKEWHAWCITYLVEWMPIPDSTPNNQNGEKNEI